MAGDEQGALTARVQAGHGDAGHCVVQFCLCRQAGSALFFHNAAARSARGWNWQDYLPGTRSDLIWQSQIEFCRHAANFQSVIGLYFERQSGPVQGYGQTGQLEAADFAPNWACKPA